MGQFNEILSSRFNNLLRAGLPLDEQQGAPTCAPEIMPVFQLQPARPEHEFLLGELLAGGWVNAGAVAGQAAFLTLRNPAGSNALVILEAWRCTSSLAADRVLFAIQQAGTGTPIVTGPMAGDGRWGGKLPAAVLAQGNTLIALPAALGAVITPQATTSFADGPAPWIIPPGWQFIVQAAANLQTLEASFKWREHRALPAELV